MMNPTTMNTTNWGALGAGNVLIAPGVHIPRHWHRVGETLAGGWSRVTAAAQHSLDGGLSEGGWKFFFIAGAVSGNGYFWSRPDPLARALVRLIREAVSQGCNCLQMEGAERFTFLGMPYVHARAHPRQIQKGQIFTGAASE